MVPPGAVRCLYRTWSAYALPRHPISPVLVSHHCSIVKHNYPYLRHCTTQTRNMSSHWLQKMRTYFERIDFDKDGSITRADFEGMATRFAKDGALDAAAKDALMATLTGVWDKYLITFAGGNDVNKEAFVEGMKKQVKDPQLKASLEGPLPLFFNAVDRNADGEIDQGEYEEFFKILGLDPVMAPASFQAIDADGDGQLTTAEFVSAGLEFFLSEDPSKATKLFWGPLVA